MLLRCYLFLKKKGQREKKIVTFFSKKKTAKKKLHTRIKIIKVDVENSVVYQLDNTSLI